MLSRDTLPSLLEGKAREQGDRPFVTSLEEGRTYTYAELNARANQAAHLLRSVSASPGKPVSILLPNGMPFLIAYFGAMKAGSIAGTVNPDLKAPEIAYIVGDSESSIVVTDAEGAAKIGEVRGQLPRLQRVVRFDEDLERALNRHPTSTPRVGILPTDPCEILYTSGTTGHPKGALITHANFLAAAECFGSELGFDASLRILCFLPLFHTEAQFVSVINAVRVGGSVVVARKFSSHRFWSWVADERVSVVSAVPTVFSIMLDMPRDESRDYSSLRLMVSSAASLPVEVLRAWQARFRVPIVEGYGLTESACYATLNPKGYGKAGSVGVPLACTQLRVVDDHGHAVPPREAGEIVLRGWNVFPGYWRNPEATRDAFKGGWFHTGDVGYVDEDGYVFIVDRKKDMINRGGQKIYPREVDEVLFAHPHVRNAAAFGAPHPLLGEEVAAFVELRDGTDVPPESIIAFCRERLADYKVPKEVLFIDAIPKGPSGKNLRRKLREEYLRRKGPSGPAAGPS